MQTGSAPWVASDGNEDKEYLMTLSISELILKLRTAFRMIDYDRVEEVLVERQSKLKAQIKELTEKLELETLVRMAAEEEFKERLEKYERLLVSDKKNNGLDYENTVAELRMKSSKLEIKKRLAESEAESWKRKCEELSERLLMIEKGENSFVNGDTHMGIGGKAEVLSSIRGNTDPGVSDKVMGEKDMNVVHVCDNEEGNTTAGSSPSQRKDLKSGNTPVSAAEVTRQSPDSPNKALLGASGISAEDMDKEEDNEVDMDDHECGNTAADNPQYHRKTDDCGSTRAVDDDGRQSLDTPNTSVLANASLGSQKVVIEIKDSGGDDDDECIPSGALSGKKATRDIAAAIDDTGHSSISGIIVTLKRKWFPEAGNSFDGLNKNLVDGSETNDDSSSSSSSSESEIHKVQLPSNFLCSTGGKRRKT